MAMKTLLRLVLFHLWIGNDDLCGFNWEMVPVCFSFSDIRPRLQSERVAWIEFAADGWIFFWTCNPSAAILGYSIPTYGQKYEVHTAVK